MNFLSALRLRLSNNFIAPLTGAEDVKGFTLSLTELLNSKAQRRKLYWAHIGSGPTNPSFHRRCQNWIEEVQTANDSGAVTMTTQQC